MYGEYLIFSKRIQYNQEGEGLSAVLSSDHDTRLVHSYVHEIHINLQFGMVTPVVIITFMDGAGTMFSRGDVGLNKPFYLELSGDGLKQTRATVIPLSLVSVRYGNTSNANQNGSRVEYKLTFMFDGWKDFTGQQKNRFWGDKKCSDVVSEILASYDFVTDVETTNEAQDVIIQPYFTDAQMIKYLTDRMDTTSGGAPLIAPSLFTERVAVKSKKAFLTDGKSGVSSGNNATLKLIARTIDPGQYKKEVQENNGFPPNFVYFDAKVDMAKVKQNMASGVSMNLYDFETSTHTHTDVNIGDNTTISRYLYGVGNDQHFSPLNDAVDMIRLRNKVDKDILEFKKFEIVTVGCQDFEIGQIIELVIPSSPDSGTGSYAESDSGFYMIGEINHKLQFGQLNTYTTTLTLMREGVDSDDDGFVSGNRFI